MKLGAKYFTADEISRLKNLNSPLATQTTWEIFQQIDARTRNCELTHGNTYSEGDPWGEGSHDYVGTWLNGVKYGVGSFIDGDRIEWVTLVDGKYEGFFIST